MTKKEHEERWPNKEFGEIHVTRKWNLEKGKPYREYPMYYVQDDGWEIWLLHSCDEWIIGTVEKTKEFAKDLAEAIKYCEQNP